ncbi:iron ABC transporter substrate-binding protein [Methyloceanibacter superfactus]|uniref:Iron ABC transporter substrate-binding protein n=1 Tax=Methyloceanibacter superfactus TaxID=1774969 RepID=A0A1E3W6Z8_9HYPH|nr:Fe(3+) ABC transporter substrate-binding protein [Methyloceanibacter superfactus]ODS01564.1 iron ABC transporter substrate-binding protein [Methyloceanibacter superfactus]
MRSTLARAAALAILISASALPFARAETPGEVNIYSYRQPYLIDPLLQEFTAETGIKANVIFAEKGLIERMQAEGRNSPADLLLTVDIGNLSQATAAGIAQPVVSETIEASIPATYRGENNEWIGLTRRARVVYASKERVKQDSITYEDLADPKWRGKICIRSGQHVYNVALIASMIAHHGEEWTEQWLRGVKANLARKPAGNDRLQVKGVYAGECDIAIGNTYYMGAMLTDEKNPDQKAWANSVSILFPNTGDRGTHVNVSGAVLAKNAPHKDNAIKLLEFLASDKGQEMYAEVNNEYPVKAGVPWSALVQSWGEFKPDPISLNEIAALRKAASELVDKVGFDEGPSS